MSMIEDRAKALGLPCRHFNGREFAIGCGDGRGACGRGHPIRKIVIGANGGDNTGILYKTPCRPGPERVAECPDYDPKTIGEIAEERAAMAKEMERAAVMMKAAGKWRAKMVAEKRPTGRASCPCCGGKETVRVRVAIGYNNHLACKCEACGVGFIE